jgi:hypothetical protein
VRQVARAALVALFLVLVTLATPARAEAPEGCSFCPTRTSDPKLTWLYRVTKSYKHDGFYCDVCFQSRLKCTECGKTAFRPSQTARVKVEGEARTISLTYGEIPDPARLRCEACVLLAAQRALLTDGPSMSPAPDSGPEPLAPTPPAQVSTLTASPEKPIITPPPAAPPESNANALAVFALVVTAALVGIVVFLAFGRSDPELPPPTPPAA